MHSKLFCTHFVPRTAKVNFQTCMNMVLNNGPMNMNIWLMMSFCQFVQLVFHPTEELGVFRRFNNLLQQRNCKKKLDKDAYFNPKFAINKFFFYGRISYTV